MGGRRSVLHTYYDVLGVRRTATAMEIDRAWESAQRRLRDTGRSEQFQNQMRKIRETLLDPRLRADYDRSLDFGQVVDTALLPPPPPGFRPQPPGAQASAPAAPRAASGRQEPGGADAPGAAGRRPLAAWLLVLGAMAFGAGGWFLWQRAAGSAAQGVYLLDASGQPVAVVVAKDPRHLFPGNAKPARAALLYHLQTKKAVWLGEAVVGLKYTEGEAAPQALVQEGLAAAEVQDVHQSLR